MASKKFNEKYNGSIAYYYADAFNWTDARTVINDFSTDNYHIVDIRASRNFKLNQANGSLSLVLKNLLDDYSDYQIDPDNSTAPQVIQNTTAYIDFRVNF